ncbi:hypothetical protein FGO68_gene8645 [Halteria grandinella]|uniref:Uncharacterized protein n=1 Tax=Halteria grandinella TaxID=5974 RepID=A0A8J8T7W7_HALGN|nr:hypothetical protein FGO68_gene8645 [Halteria grandinella]
MKGLRNSVGPQKQGKSTVDHLFTLQMNPRHSKSNSILVKSTNNHSLLKQKESQALAQVKKEAKEVFEKGNKEDREVESQEVQWPKVEEKVVEIVEGEKSDDEEDTTQDKQSLQALDKKYLESYRRDLLITFEKKYRDQIKLVREQFDRTLDKKLDAIRASYILELKMLKDTIFKQRANIKHQHTLILKLTRLMNQQEMRISTDDYRPSLEFDRPPELSIFDIIRMKQEQVQKQFEISFVELPVQEYSELKKRSHDLEVRNAILTQQVLLLKSKAFTELGTLSDYNKEMQKEAAKKEFNMSSPDDKLQSTEELLKKKEKEISERRSSTYQDAIVIKGLAAHEGEKEKNGTIVVQMLSKGIAPRPEQEILFEMKLLDEMKGKLQKDKEIKPVLKEPQSQEEFKQAFNKLSDDHALEREMLEKQIQQRDKLVEIYKDKNVKTKAELERALQLLYSRMKTVKEIVDTKLKDINSQQLQERATGLSTIEVDMSPQSLLAVPNQNIDFVSSPVKKILNGTGTHERFTPTPQDLLQSVVALPPISKTTNEQHSPTQIQNNKKIAAMQDYLHLPKTQRAQVEVHRLNIGLDQKQNRVQKSSIAKSNQSTLSSMGLEAANFPLQRKNTTQFINQNVKLVGGGQFKAGIKRMSLSTIEKTLFSQAALRKVAQIPLSTASIEETLRVQNIAMRNTGGIKKAVQTEVVSEAEENSDESSLMSKKSEIIEHQTQTLIPPLQRPMSSAIHNRKSIEAIPLDHLYLYKPQSKSSIPSRPHSQQRQVRRSAVQSMSSTFYKGISGHKPGLSSMFEAAFDRSTSMKAPQLQIQRQRTNEDLEHLNHNALTDETPLRAQQQRKVAQIVSSLSPQQKKGVDQSSVTGLQLVSLAIANKLKKVLISKIQGQGYLGLSKSLKELNRDI